MGAVVRIHDASGAISKAEVDRIARLLKGQGVNPAVLHRRSIPETARDLGSRSRYQLVWFEMDDADRARTLARLIEGETGKTCRVDTGEAS